MKYISQSKSWKYGPSGTMYSCRRMPLGGLTMWRFSPWRAISEESGAESSGTREGAKISSGSRQVMIVLGIVLAINGESTARERRRSDAQRLSRRLTTGNL